MLYVGHRVSNIQHMNKMAIKSNKNQIQKLKEYFEKRSDVVMAFIFGSRAKEKAREVSDWDIAVYFKPEKNYVEWEEQQREYPAEDEVWNNCIEILQTDNVDLIVLNRAPISIADSAIKGSPLVVKDYRLWLDFMLIASREAESYREFVNDYYEISRRSASITPQDEESLKKTLSFLEEQIALYEYFEKFTEKEYSNDVHKRNDVERWVENMVNASIDAAKIIVASQKKPIPDTYKDTMKQAIWVLNLSEDFIKKLEYWIKLRNVLAHEYLDIKWKRIENFIKDSETYFKAFIKEAQGYITANKG